MLLQKYLTDEQSDKLVCLLAHLLAECSKNTYDFDHAWEIMDYLTALSDKLSLAHKVLIIPQQIAIYTRDAAQAQNCLAMFRFLAKQDFSVIQGEHFRLNDISKPLFSALKYLREGFQMREAGYDEEAEIEAVLNTLIQVKDFLSSNCKKAITEKFLEENHYDWLAKIFELLDDNLRQMVANKYLNSCRNVTSHSTTSANAIVIFKNYFKQSALDAFVNAQLDRKISSVIRLLPPSSVENLVQQLLDKAKSDDSSIKEICQTLLDNMDFIPVRLQPKAADTVIKFLNSNSWDWTFAGKPFLKLKPHVSEQDWQQLAATYPIQEPGVVIQKQVEESIKLLKQNNLCAQNVKQLLAIYQDSEHAPRTLILKEVFDRARVYPLIAKIVIAKLDDLIRKQSPAEHSSTRDFIIQEIRNNKTNSFYFIVLERYSASLEKRERLEIIASLPELDSMEKKKLFLRTYNNAEQKDLELQLQTSSLRMGS